MNIERWRSLMARLGADAHSDTYEALERAYSEPHRFYHTGEHLSNCLDLVDEVEGLAQAIEEVEVALWFHDAVYVPQRPDNETKSAQWASDFLTSACVPDDTNARVRKHILATMHDQATTHDPGPTGSDSALVVDIDLSILGAAPEIYAQFETNVRKEYRWVPKALFRRRRRQILESFLARSSVYATPHFRTKLEAAARKNLQTAIAALR